MGKSTRPRKRKRNNQIQPQVIYDQVINTDLINDYEQYNALLPPPITKKESLPPKIQRYWYRRKNLFSMFDHDIRMDETGWFSVTPEAFATHIAKRCRCDTIIDLFAGVGGNAIQFAFTCELVYSVEIDPVRLACSMHNASVYGVNDRIEFILGESLTWLEGVRLVPDVIFLSPPWGGPEYLEIDEYTPEEHMPINWERLLRASLDKTPNLAIYLPKNLSWKTIQMIAEQGLDVEVEEMYAWNGIRAVTLYTGELARLPQPITK